MHTENSVDIDGDIDEVWELASRVERWPVILPHYRYVRVLAEDGPRRTVAMGARRDWLPVAWTAIVEPLPATRRLRFEHIGGVARGMRVEWRIVQHDRFVRATIAHELTSPYWLIRSRLGEYILGRHFVAYIAGQTLHRIKRLVEAGPRPGRVAERTSR